MIFSHPVINPSFQNRDANGSSHLPSNPGILPPPHCLSPSRCPLSPVDPVEIPRTVGPATPWRVRSVPFPLWLQCLSLMKSPHLFLCLLHGYPRESEQEWRKTRAFAPWIVCVDLPRCEGRTTRVQWASRAFCFILYAAWKLCPLFLLTFPFLVRFFHIPAQTSNAFSGLLSHIRKRILQILKASFGPHQKS